jgi:hypothetical protein
MTAATPISPVPIPKRSHAETPEVPARFIILWRIDAEAARRISSEPWPADSEAGLRVRIADGVAEAHLVAAGRRESGEDRTRSGARTRWTPVAAVSMPAGHRATLMTDRFAGLLHIDVEGSLSATIRTPDAGSDLPLQLLFARTRLLSTLGVPGGVTEAPELLPQ